MSTAKKLITSATAILLLVTTVCAQQHNVVGGSGSPIMVTATADRVRFTAPSTVVQMRIEVYSAKGEKLFDNEIRGGNVFDWYLQDGQAGRVSDGSYFCVITSKTLSGRMSQKMGNITIENNVPSVQPTDTTQLTGQQRQAIGPLEEDASVTVLKEGENQTPTIIAHNGEDGQIIRGQGALSFRIGDFFSGKNTEQMRLTSAGNLGIGITNPQVRLDVDGVIRATQGIVFPDGSVQFSASSRVFGTASRKPGQFGKGAPGQEHFETQSPLAGTQDRLAKWIDNAGTLGDSAIVDVNGAIGIGTNNPQTGLDYHNAQAPFFTRDFPANPGNAVAGLQLGLSNVGSRNVNVGPSFLFFSENTAGAKSFLGRVSGVWENPTAGSEAGAIFFQVRANSGDVNALTERMRITSNGNVGIGTGAPAYKLHVLGQDVRVEGPQGIFPRFSLNFRDGLTNEKWQNYASTGSLNFTALNLSETAETFWLQVNRGSGTAISSIVLPNGNVGIGTFGPNAKLSVVAVGSPEIAGSAMSSTFRTTAGSLGSTAGDELSLASIGFLAGSGNNSSLGIRARRITAGNSWPTSAIGLGMDVDNTVRAGDATVWLHANGNVGIGQSNPTAKLTVEGTIQSNAGGFKFPDGSVQTTAANTAFTMARSSPPLQLSPFANNGILFYDVPAGKYLVTATVAFINTANAAGQNNSRNLSCQMNNGEQYSFDIPGAATQTVSFHTVVDLTGGLPMQQVDLFCDPGAATELFASTRRLTAVKIEGSIVIR